MIGKTMMFATFALATAGALPAIAQSTGSGAPAPTGSAGTQSPGMTGSSDTMNSPTAPKMTEKQTAAWQKCQAMPSEQMMKNKRCVKMSKMQGMSSTPM